MRRSGTEARATATAALCACLWAAALAGPAAAQTRAVTGQAGILGEWELTSTVTENTSGQERSWTGPLLLKHVGFCGPDGPEEKTGTLRLRLSGPTNEITAILLIEGAECAFQGRREGTSHTGIMTCPDRRGVPMLLSVE